MVGDLGVETMAPRKPVDANRPVGKFYTKFGRHLQSVGYQVEDLAGLMQRLQAKGVNLGKPDGARLEVYDSQTATTPTSTRGTRRCRWATACPRRSGATVEPEWRAHHRDP
jgi:hypothetical protein